MNLTKSLLQLRRTASLAVVGLCIITTAQALPLIRSSNSGNDLNITRPQVTSTPFLPLFPNGLAGQALVPTYSYRGGAFAYEIGDDFQKDPAPKIDLNFFTGEASEQFAEDGRAVEQTYGDASNRVTDKASSKVSFTGTPRTIGIDVEGVGIVKVTGVTASQSIDLTTEQEGVGPTLATGQVLDPFFFRDLPDDYELNIESSISAGTKLQLDNQGTFQLWMEGDYEVLQRYTGSSNIPSLETLYDVTIGVGFAADQSVGIAVDFVSNLALGLDDAAAAASLIDAFTFDSAINTFTLLDEFTIFDGLFPRPVGVTDFDLSFNVSSVLTSKVMTGEQSRFVYEPYRDGSTGNVPVPEPAVIALFTAGLFGMGFARRSQS